MPNNFDFSKLQNIKTMEVNPQGWVSPLSIEYGITDNIEVHGIMSYCWRVKGTQHTFVIPVLRMDFLSSGDYQKHFNEILGNFREDYISWAKEGFIYEWATEYRDQFARFIII